MIVVGAAIGGLYAVNPGLFNPSEVRDPIAVAVPLPTEETSTETPTPEPTPGPMPTLTPEPPPLVAYGGWNLDCPGCAVVLLDTREPEVVGAVGLRPGQTIRVAGCTRAQTTVPHRYIFEATSRRFSSVVTFNPEEYPQAVNDLECFEMLGEYRETNEFAVSVRKVDGQWEYELIRGEAAEKAASTEWEPMGVLNEFVITEWTELSEIEYAVVLRVRTDSPYAQRLAALTSNTPTPEPSPTSTAIPKPTPEPIPELPPTPTAIPKPTPALTATPRSTSIPRATSTPRPTNTPRPTSTPRPTATPAPTYAETLASAKRLMVELINEARAGAGSPPLALGNNPAAQAHADNALAECFSSHWGLDGTKPYMRYTLAGGYQANAENVSGLDVCVRAGQGYAAIRSVEREVHEAMDGLLNSPGHKRTIIDPAYREVSLGIAWDRYNFRVVQQLEGDYVAFEELPTLKDGALSFKGILRNGASIVPDNINKDLGAQVYYDPPLQELTRGQLVQVYSSSPGGLVASIRPEAKDGWHYAEDNFTMCLHDYPEPQDFSPSSPAPRTPEESKRMHSSAKAKVALCKDVTIPWLDASRWELSKDSFDVRVSLRSILRQQGPGVYTLVLWANIGGEKEVISEYSIFHDTEPPDGYGSR